MSGANDFRPQLAAVLEAARRGPPPVEVAGIGSLADQLREQLHASGSGGGQPGTVVDTTGDPEQLERVMQRVDDLGMVILSGPPLPDRATIELYADVHVRGLTVICVPPGGG